MTSKVSDPGEGMTVASKPEELPSGGAVVEGLGPTGRPIREFPAPASISSHGPARVLAMVNQKGGVGKTTSTINLGAALAELGRRVLLVDFDPQGALSVGLGVNPLQLDQTVYNVLMERSVGVEDVMLKTGVAGLDLLPSNIDLSAAEVQLVTEVAREQVLASALDAVRDDYDYVLIDCQPSLGLLTVNALTAARGVIIPLECEYFALRGVALLMQTIDKVRERLNPSLEVEGILATMYDGRTIHGRQVLERLVSAFGEAVFHTVINRTVRFPETTVAGEPITSYASNSTGATAYRQLARELIFREQAQSGPGEPATPSPAVSAAPAAAAAAAAAAVSPAPAAFAVPATPASPAALATSATIAAAAAAAAAPTAGPFPAGPADVDLVGVPAAPPSTPSHDSTSEGAR